MNCHALNAPAGVLRAFCCLAITEGELMMTVSNRERRLITAPSRPVATRLDWADFDLVEQLAAGRGISRSEMV